MVAPKVVFVAFNRIKIAVLACLLSGTALAQDSFSWLPNLLGHPNVAVMRGDIDTQFWQVKELQAQLGPEIEVTSQGDVPILSNFSSEFSRDSDSNPYLDIVVSGTYTLYDFGQSQQNIEAEERTYEVKQIEYVAAVENEASRLLTLAIEYQKLLQQLTILKSANPELLVLKQQLEQRYQAGLGTLPEVRQIQVQMLDMESQVTLLENRLQALQLTVEEQYELSSEQLVAVWHDVKGLLTTSVETLEAQRTMSLSQMKRASLLHKQLAVKAQAMPTVLGELNATIYDVTRSFDNHKLAGQLRLKMPVYDSGYRDARVAKLQQAMLSEMEANRQILRQKQFTLNEHLRQSADIQASQQLTQEKLDNLQVQYQSLQQSIGKTSNDISGLGSYISQIVGAQSELAGLQAQQMINILERLLTNEQLLHRLGIAEQDML